jgi:hypothetical protein
MPQGLPTGYPTYRLEFQTIGSQQRRLRNCMIIMRVKPYLYGAPEYVAMGNIPDVACTRPVDGKPRGATVILSVS